MLIVIVENTVRSSMISQLDAVAKAAKFLASFHVWTEPKFKKWDEKGSFFDYVVQSLHIIDNLPTPRFTLVMKSA